MSIRFKLTTIAVAAILVANALLSFLALHYLGGVWLEEVQTRVRRNLSSARAAYEKHAEQISAFLEGAALDRDLAAALAEGRQSELRARAHGLLRAGPMEFVTLLDGKGTVICRPKGDRLGSDLSADPLVAEVLRTRRPATGTVVFCRDRLLAEDAALAERARFEVIPTPAARPSPDRFRCEGMVLAAAAPIADAGGELLGILYGGILLNRRYDIVDSIQEEVFPGGHYYGKVIGTVTVFLGDLRISTNVQHADGSRAVGTRLSASVSEEVLDRGGTWAAPAFVVNDWYITAYEPIRDPAGETIGVLYVGLLQSPFVARRNTIMAVFLAIVGSTTLASLILLTMANALVLRPVRHVVTMAHKVIGGDLSARVGIRPPGEMGVLCRAIDSMSQAVAEREEMLRETTRQQVRRSEQLASVGRLAAGVAHEINNPLTGVLAFADMLRTKENMDGQDREDLEVIIRETKRVREIVRGLLDFARETPSIKAPLDLDELIRRTTRLLGRREAFQKIYIVEDLADDLPLVEGDQNRLQQVILNLSLNACEAMPEGGTLMIRTLAENRTAVVKVSDTGCGIERQHLDRVFEPFFTTKPVGGGTGLGLSVSYGIVHQHGGTIKVESAVRMGTTFTITLPAMPSAADGADFS